MTIPPPKILQEPNKVLHTVCKKIVDFKEAKEIADKLEVKTKNLDKPWRPWLGMAANQIGYLKRVVVIKESDGKYKAMVNPEIIEGKWKFPTISRCFSVKGTYLVNTYLWIKVRFQDLKGNYHTEVFRGGKASVLQQEINHINGLLISDIGKRIF